MWCTPLFAFLERGRGIKRAVVDDENFSYTHFIAVIKGLLRLWTLLCIAVPWLTRGIDLSSVFLSPPHLLHVTSWRGWHFPIPQMLSSKGVHSTQCRAAFIFTIGIPNQVCTISCPFWRGSLSMTLWRTSYPEKRSFSWSNSWLIRTLPAAKLSPWYSQGCSTDYLRLDP